MKLQFIASAAIIAAVTASPRGRYQVPDAAVANANDNVQFPTSYNSQQDVIDLLEALSTKHTSDVQNLYNTKSANVQTVLKKLKKQVEKGTTKQQKIHNAKLVLINNASVFNMTKPEMVQFIKNNKGKVDSLINDISIADIQLLLDQSLSQTVDEVGAQIDTFISTEIADPKLQAIALDAKTALDQAISSNTEVQSILNDNGSDSLADLGQQAGQFAWSWIQSNTDVEQQLTDLTADIQAQVNAQ